MKTFFRQNFRIHKMVGLALRAGRFAWLISILSILQFCLPARAAADFYTVVTVVVTNNLTPGIKTNGTDTITVNGDTRTGTNIIASNPAKFFFGTNVNAVSATNLYNHIALYSFGSGSTRLSPRWLYTNTFQLFGQINQAVAAAAAGTWGTVNLTNYTTTNRTEMVAPSTAVASITQTNFGNAIADYLNVGATFLSQTAYSMSNYLNQAQAQQFSNKTFQHTVLLGPSRFNYLTNMSGTNFAFTNGVLSQIAVDRGTLAGISSFQGTNAGAVNIGFTNGFEVSVTNINPVLSNAVNYGNAIRSEGSGGNSLQVGSNAIAAGTRSISIGNSSVATNADTTSIGTGALATNQYALALGNVALAYGVDSMAIGRGSLAATNFAMALGQGSAANANGALSFGAGSAANAEGSLTIGVGGSVSSGAYQGMAIGNGSIVSFGIQGMSIGPNAFNIYSNSLALGPPNNAGTGVTTTTTNQIRVGTSTHTTSIPGALEAATDRNAALVGTNTVDGILALKNPLTVSSIAPGHNVIDSSSNTVLYLTGSPSGAWTLGGFTGAKNDGRQLLVINQTGFDINIQNESGTAPTAGDRILTYATAGGVTNVTVTGNGVMWFNYSATASRWILVAPSTDVIASGTNGMNTVSTNNWGGNGAGVNVSSAATSLGLIANPNAVPLATNTAGVVTVQFVPLIFSASNYPPVFNYGDWVNLFNEEFVASVTSTTSGQMGQYPWTLVSSGTVPSLGQAQTEAGTYSCVSLVTTQSTSGRMLLCPGPASSLGGFAFTNAEYYCEARFKCSATNVANDVSTMRVGLGSQGAAANGDLLSGAYFMINTNANTNTLVCVTGRNSVYQFTYTPFFIQPNQWYTAAFYLDATGTNCIFFAGNTRKTMTAVATNQLNIPGLFSLVTGTIQNDRMASISGTDFRTNYIENFKLWVRDPNL